MKKILCLSLAIIMVLALAAFAQAEEQEVMPSLPLQPYYLEFAGIVQEINPYYNPDGSESGKQFVLAQNAEEQLMNFVVDEDTYMLTANELAVGANIVGFYLGNRPMIMIYPPQVHADLLAIEPAEEIKVADFDQDLVSSDNQLKLNISTETKIAYQDGTPATPSDLQGEENRQMAVFYTVSTRSIPAQTTPLRIILLQTEEALAEEPLAEETAEPQFAIDGMALAVENVLLLDAPPVYVREDGMVMIPLRAVAEALGYEVGWQSGVVLLDGAALVIIGQNGAELQNDHTYVPLSFFRETLKVNNAYVLEQQVYIDNGEKME